MTVTQNTSPPAVLQRLRVWDLPTRLFHWLLVASVVGSIATAKIGGAAMVWHFRLGLLAMGLLLFRLMWGLVGGHWSRFARFLYGPATLLRYLKGREAPGEHLDVGHSPLGALSVWGALVLLVVQVATGLVGDDEIASTGPLNRYVATATGLAATAWHKGYGQWLLLGWIALHLAAMAYYRWAKGRRLVAAMVTGDKQLPPGTPAARDDTPRRLLALVCALVAAAVVLAVARLGG